MKTVKSPYLYNRSTDFDEIWQIIVSVYVVVQHALMHTCKGLMMVRFDKHPSIGEEHGFVLGPA